MNDDATPPLVSIRRFWVVVKPTATSELGDIFLECTLESYAEQTFGHSRESIVGIYLDESHARRVAVRLLRARDWLSQ